MNLDVDGKSIINRLTKYGFSSLPVEERAWVTEMTKTRHPYWDPVIQDAYLELFKLNGKARFKD